MGLRVCVHGLIHNEEGEDDQIVDHSFTLETQLGGRSMDDVLRSLRPPPHFKQRDALDSQGRSWSAPKLNAALARIAEAAKAARLNSALEGTLTERLLIDLGTLSGQRKS